jgi:hypothetical protein
MNQFTEIYTIRFSKEQLNFLRILESHNIQVSKFIRLAIKEKIKRDWKQIKEVKNKEYCPF